MFRGLGWGHKNILIRCDAKEMCFAVFTCVQMIFIIYSLLWRCIVYVIEYIFVFPAVASTCNVVLMRNNELSEGIEVVDEQNNVLGTSKVAAKKASQV